MARPKREPIERFNEKYIINEDTGCWEYTGHINQSGYGVFRGNDSKWTEAHRFSFEYHKGPIKKGLVCCHSCNNRKCCNPEHLRQDTQSNNLIDMSYQNTNPTQRLTVEDVISIKKAQEQYYRGQNLDLAKLYNVSPVTISSIKRGITWSHISIT